MPSGGGTAQDLHAVAIDMQTIALDPHFAGEPAVGGVKACQVFDAGHVGQIIDRHNFETSLGPSLEQRTQDATTYPAVAVECNFVGTRLGHGGFSDQSESMEYSAECSAVIAGKPCSHRLALSQWGVCTSCGSKACPR
nr:hypothetical protein GCM10020185_39340 [Pseudomonas brassicacearum subsp. brassicacearum]